jgi:uncharacterized protein YcfJ
VHVYHHYEPRPVVTREVVVERYVADPPVVVERAPAYRSGGFTPSLNPGSLMGAALGGLIGSQVGGGRGKLAATAAGTLGGFLLGDHATSRYR